MGTSSLNHVIEVPLLIPNDETDPDPDPPDATTTDGSIPVVDPPPPDAIDPCMIRHRNITSLPTSTVFVSGSTNAETVTVAKENKVL